MDITNLSFTKITTLGQIVRGVWRYWITHRTPEWVGMEMMEIGLVRGNTGDVLEVAFPCSTICTGIFSRREAISILMLVLSGDRIQCTGRLELTVLDSSVWQHNGQAHTVRVSTKGVATIPSGRMTPVEMQRYGGPGITSLSWCALREEYTMFAFATSLCRLGRWFGPAWDPQCPRDIGDLREAMQGLTNTWSGWRTSNTVRSIVALAVAYPAMLDDLATAYGTISAAIFDCAFPTGAKLAMEIGICGSASPVTIPYMGAVLDVYVRTDIQNTRVPVLSGTSRSYVSLSGKEAENCTITGTFAALLMAEIPRAAHRNGWDDTSIVFCVKGVSAAAYRGAAVCATCHHSECQNCTPLVYAGNTYITAVDAVSIVEARAADDFRKLVADVVANAPECAAIGNRCSDESARSMVPRRTKGAKAYSWKAHTNDDGESCRYSCVWTSETAVARYVELLGTSGELALCTWIPSVLDVIRRGISSNASGQSSEPTRVNDEQTSGDDARPASTRLVPGYDEIRSAHWDAFPLFMECAPPCIQQITRACYTVRHPNDDQRMLLTGFLAHIDDLLDDEKTFLRVWMKFFIRVNKPELRGRFFSDKAQGGGIVEHIEEFAKSEFGRSVYKRLAKLDATARVGCSYACKTGTCPFAPMATTMSITPDMIGPLMAIEDSWMTINNHVKVGNATQRITQALTPELHRMATQPDAGVPYRAKRLCRGFVTMMLNNTTLAPALVGQHIATGRPIDVYTSIYKITHPSALPPPAAPQ